MPPAVMEAAKMPPKVTDKYVLFFGYEGPEPECTFQQWVRCLLKLLHPLLYH